MEDESEENEMKAKTALAEIIPAEETNDISSELNEPRWSVVSFEAVAAGNLPYAEARNRLDELQKQKISGLCIVTDEAAARVAKN